MFGNRGVTMRLIWVLILPGMSILNVYSQTGESTGEPCTVSGSASGKWQGHVGGPG